MSIHKRFILLIVFIPASLLALTGCGGGLSLEKATELVMSELIKPDELDQQLIVFSLPEPITPEDRIQPYAGPDLERPGEAYSLENEAWFFYIDDAPGAMFTHPTRFVVVDRSTKEISVFDEVWWPVLNGSDLWTATDVYWDESNWAFSNVEWRPAHQESAFSPHMLASLRNRHIDDERGFGTGLVVNGWDDGQNLKEDMQDNADHMLENFFNSDFDTEYIGPPADTGIVDRIRNWILGTAAVMQPSETAVIYITGHGGVTEDQDGYVSLGQEWLYEHDLVDWLGSYDPGVHVIVIVDACYSGSFVDGLRDVADVAVTSTGSLDFGYGDIDPKSDPNPDDQGTEFSSGYAQDWNEILNDEEQQAEAFRRAEQNGTNFWEEVAMMSYLSAVEKDISYQMGWTFPNAVRGDPLHTKSLPIDKFNRYTSPPQEVKETLRNGLQADKLGDVIYSKSTVKVENPKPATDINFFEGFWIAFDPNTQAEYSWYQYWFGNTLFPCDESPEGMVTVCPDGAGAMPQDDVLMLIMTLDSDVPIVEPEFLYVYSAVLDTDGDSANNFVADPYYDWDYYQGTDRWYTIAWDPYQHAWFMEVTNASAGYTTVASNARGAILGDLVIFLIPADEISVQQPGYRLTAFAHKGYYAPANSSGDVTGADPTEPLLIVPEESLSLSE
ncbi:MAG: C13 family peptidase [Anaerolineales bacterium]